MEIEKHLNLTGSSKVSWKDAIVRTIAEARKNCKKYKQSYFDFSKSKNYG